MKKQDQEKLLRLLDHKEKLKNAYKNLDKQILKLAHEIGPNSAVIEVSKEIRENYTNLNIAEDQEWLRLNLVDNMLPFVIAESEDEEPVTMFKVAKFTRFEIDYTALKRKPKDA